MHSNGYRLALTPLCAALAVLFFGPVCAEDDVSSPKVVIPRMISQQASLNATQGGQLTLITSNGVLQGPAASMLQVIAPQAAAGAAPSQSHAAIIASVLRNVQPGFAIPPVQVAGGSPAVVGAISSLPTGISIVSGAPLIAAGGPINVTGGQPINFQSFQIGAGSALSIHSSSGIISLSGTSTQIGSSGVTVLGNLVSNGQPFVPSPNGITVNAAISPINAGALTITGAGGAGAGGAVGLTGARLVTPITVR